MKNPFKEVTSTSNSAHPGTVTRKIVRERAVELVVRNGRAAPEISKSEEGRDHHFDVRPVTNRENARSRLANASAVELLLLLCLLPAAARAQFNCTTNNGAITIAAYTGPGSAVTIPNTINGLPVGGIGNAAFEFTSLTSVTIPNNVTNIGDWVFSGCVSLTAITVDSLNPVYSSSGDGVLFNKSQTALIQYPGGKAGSYLVPSGVTSIGTGAFSRCNSLTTVTIPNTTISVWDWAFSECSSLTAITVDALNPVYGSSAEGVLFTKSQTSLIQYPGGKTGNYLVPNGVTNLANGAFARCTSLTGVTVPNTITQIGQEAFGGCSSLTNVTLPNSVISIGDWAFSECTSLTGITVNALNPAYSSVEGVLFNKDQTKLIQYPGGKAGSYLVPTSVTDIGSFAFLGCASLTKVTIPISVSSIGLGAFSGSSSLTSVTIPNNVTNIGDWMFQYCGSLTSVTIPNSVTSIGNFVFFDCTSLTGVFFRGNPPSVGSGAFASANNATVYYLPGTTGWEPFFGGCPTALWRPKLRTDDGSFGGQTNRFGFTIAWAPGLVVVVEACTNLVNSIWSPLRTNTLTGDSSYFSDSQSTNQPRRFYRIHAP